jgi:lipopolysaccharide transport system permease protein
LKDNNWDIVITPKKRWFDLELKELIRSKDLLFMLLRRDVVSVYKQTLLGPIWFFIQPVLSSFAFAVIFSGFGKISTDGIPAFLFYMSGMVPWLFFSTCVINNANIFYQNQSVFGKVYFPRLLIPISLTLSNVIKFSLQFSLYLAIWAYHFSRGEVHPNLYSLLLPINLLAMGLMGLGLGLIISSISIRFRDINFIIGFLMQIAMYASSVIIPVSAAGKYKWVILANPMSGIIESYKYGFIGTGYFSLSALTYSYFCALILFFIGVVLFKKAERTFIDKV